MEGTLQALKNTELDLFRAFLQICEKHKLQYFLLGGTALGAVRHQGFIPWDDDIDVGLPREDYEKFLACAQNELPDGYFLQTFVTDPDYPNNFAKLRNSNTTFIEKSMQNIKVNHGVYIDIFPLDGVHKNRFIQKMRNKYFAILHIIISQQFVLPERKRGWKARMFEKILKKIQIDYRKVTARRDRFMQKHAYKDSQIVANYCGAWGEREIMPKAYFGNGTKGVFESLEVTLPENYDAYLTQMYGDYMTPPPKEKQVGHHYCTVIDLKRPYTAYVGEE